MITDNQVEAAIRFLGESETEAAQATADRKHLEEFRKAQIAMLASSYNEGSEAERDRKARAHPEYHEHLEGYREAVRRDEEFRHKRARAIITIDAWRTQSSNRRGAERLT